MGEEKGKVTSVRESKAEGQALSGSDMAARDVLFVCPEDKQQAFLEQAAEMPEELGSPIAKVYKSFFGVFVQGSYREGRAKAVQALANYFKTLVDFLAVAEERRSAFREGAVDFSRAVEELYLLGCERKRDTNSYLIPAWHPVRLMNRLVEADLADLLSREEGVRHSVLEAVFDSQNEIRRRIRLYCRNQVYETSAEERDGTFAEACVFRQREGNTDIPYLRIWEKIHSYQEGHPGQKEIRIAVFGSLTGQRQAVEELLDPGIEVSWTNFMNVSSMGEYYFRDASGKQMFDLSNMGDTKELAREYEIILFLDINCLYRQWQSEKSADEKNVRSYCRWCLDRSESQEGFKEKVAYYRSIYDYTGLWLNSLRQQNSSSFEFDAGLFQNLMAAADEDTDIYIYIREGSSIASYNLEQSSVCNDEYYAGRRLLVYKLSKADKGKFNEDYGKFLEYSRKEMASEKPSRVYLNLWKILKSVGNGYCEAFLEKIGRETEAVRRRLIKGLNESLLILQYQINAEGKSIDIGYDVAVPPKDWEEGQRDILAARVKELSAIILNYATTESGMYCVKRYFRELLIHSVIVNARSVEDLVFAHLWSQSWMEIRFAEERLNAPQQNQDSHFGRHKLHRTVFVTVERLENLRMRRVPDMRGYFVNVFRGMACPEVNVDNFERTLGCIAECCEKFHHTGSSLYLNSTLINQ